MNVSRKIENLGIEGKNCTILDMTLNNSGERPRFKNLQQRWSLLNFRPTQVAYESHKRAGRRHLKFAIIFHHYASSSASCRSIGDGH